MGALFLLIVGVVLALWAYAQSSSGTPEDSGGGSASSPDEDEIVAGYAAFDEKIRQWGQAIGFAEGFGVPGAIPTRNNNPGDLGPGDTGNAFPVESGFTKFPSTEHGWQALFDKLSGVVNGRSRVYNMGMTFDEFGAKYANGDSNWARNVASFLGVTPGTRISDWWAS